MARKLEELPIYAKVMAFSDGVSAIIARPAFGRNRRLHDQIDEANASILANIAEGFEQSSDAHVAKFLYTAKGSVAEVIARLRRAQRSGLIGADECSRCVAMGDEVARMLGDWIKYLARCDWKDRGRFKE
jgi:four helix bundle protein